MDETKDPRPYGAGKCLEWKEALDAYRALETEKAEFVRAASCANRDRGGYAYAPSFTINNNKDIDTFALTLHLPPNAQRNRDS